MTYGYIRVSSDKQTVENQRFEIEKFCERNDLHIDGWIEETISGTKNYDKRKLGPLLKKVKKDDLIICSEISRLGRSLFMIMEILSICMISAEIERNLISMRTKEALARLKAEGRKLGRPEGGADEESHKCFPYKDKIWIWKDSGMSFRRIANRLHMSSNTVRRYYKKYIAEENDL